MKVETLPEGASRPVVLQAVLAAERSAQPFVVVESDTAPVCLAMFESDDQRLWIGRSPACDISLPDDGRVSRTHAELVRTAAGWAIADDGLSRNGTWLDGERIAGQRALRDGDVVLIGGASLRYRAPGDDLAATTLAATAGAPRPDVTEAQRRVLVELCRPLLVSPPEPVPATNRQIAAALFLSDDAVKTHMRGLYDRAGLQAADQHGKRLRLAEIALATGLVSARDL